MRSKYGLEGSKYEVERSRYGLERRKYDVERSKYEVEAAKYGSERPKYASEGVEYEDEGPKYEDQCIQYACGSPPSCPITPPNTRGDDRLAVPARVALSPCGSVAVRRRLRLGQPEGIALRRRHHDLAAHARAEAVE